MKKVFIITGEHSGDMHAANVVKKLKQINPEIMVEAIGGQKLSETGVKIFENHDKMSAMGGSLKVLFDHFNLGKRVVDYIKNVYKPDLVLLVDYGAFNLSVAKCLEGSGIKVFYYIPPQVWASRKYRLNLIKKYVDKVLCIFPFEYQMYRDNKIPVHYCGHPLISQLEFPASRHEFFRKNGFDIHKKLVSVFPGSREFELKELMDVFLETVSVLATKHPDIQFCISQAPNISDEMFNKYFKNSRMKVVKNNNQALLSVSDALILASGTVALEACLYKTPMIIAYRGPKIFYWIYLLVRCINRVSLPNIIADKDIVPEILQDKVTPNNIANEIEELLYNTEKRTDMIEKLSGVRSLLSNKNAAFEVAKQIDMELFPID